MRSEVVDTAIYCTLFDGMCKPRGEKELGERKEKAFILVPSKLFCKNIKGKPDKSFPFSRDCHAVLELEGEIGSWQHQQDSE